MVKSVSTPPESGVDALKVVLTHLVCQQLLESGVDACQQLKKVVLTQVCQQCVNVEIQPLSPTCPPRPRAHARASLSWACCAQPSSCPFATGATTPVGLSAHLSTPSCPQ